MRHTISAIFMVLALATTFAAFGSPVTPAWTYQGQLRRGGAAYNGTCNFQFSLWDAASAGTQKAGTQSINGVTVVNGLFTVTLDFRDPGTNEQPFKGDAFWLGTSVQCSGDGGFTPLDPRQPITAAPYAVSLVPGATIKDASAGYALRLNESGPGTGTAALDAHHDSDGTAVYAYSNDGIGVFGVSLNGTGVSGRSSGNGAAIYGQNTSGGYAGRFAGSVLVEGNLIVTGTLVKSSGSFRIDHPLDPEHKFLSHSFVESPDMMNIYNGNVTTDATGTATVTLPDYFAALNRDCRYQLTVVGQFAQAIVSRKIAGNTFEIRTDKPGVEVSWQVTGIRQDAYAQANPIVVEESKPAEQQGMYLYPAGFGAGEDKRIGHSNGPGPGPAAPDQSGR